MAGMKVGMNQIACNFINKEYLETLLPNDMSNSNNEPSHSATPQITVGHLVVSQLNRTLSAPEGILINFNKSYYIFQIKLCKYHYQRAYRTFDPLAGTPHTLNSDQETHFKPKEIRQWVHVHRSLLPYPEGLGLIVQQNFAAKPQVLLRPQIRDSVLPA